MAKSGTIFQWMIPTRSGQSGYIPMREAIRRALVESETNPKALCEDLGYDRHYIYNYLCGKKNELEAEKAAKILQSLGIDLKVLTGDLAPPRAPLKAARAIMSKKVRLGGKVEFGAWRDPPSGEPVYVDIPSDPTYPADEQAAFEIVDFEMGHVGAHGDLLLVRLADNPITEGCFVVLKTTRDSLQQLGVYRAHVRPEGHIEFWPATTAFDKGMAPLTIDGPKSNKSIVGVVLRIIPKGDRH